MTHPPLPDRRRPVLLLGVCLAVVVLLFLVHLGRAAAWISPLEVARELFGGRTDSVNGTIVWAIRLPRAVGCIVVGAILATVGSSFQALFRNPLAEPYVVGVSSGAAVGGAIALVFGIGGAWEGFWGGFGMTACAFLSGMASLALVFSLAQRRGVIDPQALLLSGVVVGALLSSVLSLILLAAGQDTNKVLRWLLGSMTPMFWNRVVVMAIALVGGLIILMRHSRYLNAFAVGEATARHLGVPTKRLKPLVLIVGTAMTATTVGAVGIIGFLGLVAPHIARRLIGVDWRYSLVGSAIIGSGLLLGADLIAQVAIRDTELNVGIVTAILGAPALIALLRWKPE